jgi:hypothetical protein
MVTEQLHDCSDLEHGDIIHAHRRGILQFVGRVTEIDPSQELFWAVDSIGDRRLVDLGSYDVYRPLQGGTDPYDTSARLQGHPGRPYRRTLSITADRTPPDSR